MTIPHPAGRGEEGRQSHRAVTGYYDDDNGNSGVDTSMQNLFPEAGMPAVRSWGRRDGSFYGYWLLDVLIHCLLKNGA
jgi:hypothetical protein